MTDSPLEIPCEECGENYNPNLNDKKGWTCPNCRSRQPNLSLHYRILAYLCGLGLAWTLYLLLASIRYYGRFGWGHLLPTTQAILLLVAITALILRDRPWEQAPLRATIWLVYGSFVLFYLTEPLLIVVILTHNVTARFLRMIVPLGVGLIGVGAYMTWVHVASRRLQNRTEED
jgi:hypothetical protein